MSSSDSQTVARFVTVIMGLVIGLTFLFGFGNVLNLALKLQVPVFVAPLVAPAVDLTVLGLRHLALSGASEDVLRPARRLLLAASVVTLLLNVADPVFTAQWGKAAFRRGRAAPVDRMGRSWPWSASRAERGERRSWISAVVLV